MKFDSSANKRRKSIMDDAAAEDDVAILNQLILLTQQYKRLNELMENKRTMLQRRMHILRRQRLRHRKRMHNLWLALINLQITDADKTTPETLDDDANEDCGRESPNQNWSVDANVGFMDLDKLLYIFCHFELIVKIQRPLRQIGIQKYIRKKKIDSIILLNVIFNQMETENFRNKTKRRTQWNPLVVLYWFNFKLNCIFIN